MTAPPRSGMAVFAPAGQHLPVPLGGRSPTHIPARRRRAARLRRHWRLVLVVTGVSLAGAGLALGLTGTELSVFADAAGVHVGGITLPERDRGGHGERIFAGDAVLSVASRGAHTFKAGGVALMQGRRSVGVCTMVSRPDEAVEDCDFQVGSAHMRAHDVYSATDREWVRRYANGVEVRFRVPAGGSVVPMPFPLGASMV